MNKTLLAGVVIAGILVGAFASQQIAKGPTAKELFELRTECGELAKKKAHELAKEYSYKYSSWETSFGSRYDVSENRCFVEFEADDRESSASFHALFDGQTEEPLAFQNTLHGEPNESLTGDPQCTRHKVPDVKVPEDLKEYNRIHYNDAADCINKRMGR